MTTSFLDISEQCDESLVALLARIADATAALEIPFFIVGATARDMILKHYGETPARATRDIDIGIRILNWEQFDSLRAALIGTGKFRSTNAQQRLDSDFGMPTDIVPFGDISGDEKRIQWPGEVDRVLSVLGFHEAYEFSEIVRVRRNPKLDIHVASLAGIVMTKLISWSERYPDRRRDAQDIYLVMSRYLDLGGLQRIVEERTTFEESGKELDLELAGARLLGREISQIASRQTLVTLNEILSLEIEAGVESRLVGDMVWGGFREDAVRFDRTMEHLRNLERGVADTISTSTP